MKSKIIIIISLIILLLIIDNIGRIYQNTKVSINPLSEVYLSFYKSGGLVYFYEPKRGIYSIPLTWKNTNGPAKPMYTINSDTLNQVNEVSIAKPAEVFRIVTLGNSFTFGLFVNTQDNYPSQLQGLINRSCKNSKIEVINLGVEGYDIAYSVERFKIRGQKYNPDLILWFLIGLDMGKINEKYTPKFASLTSEVRKKAQFQQPVKREDVKTLAIQALEQVEKEAGGEDRILDMQTKHLEEIKRYFDKKIVVFTTPLIPKQRIFLDNFVSSHKNYFLYRNLPPLWSSQGTTLPDGHPSPVGYKLISENLFDYLNANKMLPCSL